VGWGKRKGGVKARKYEGQDKRNNCLISEGEVEEERSPFPSKSWLTPIRPSLSPFIAEHDVRWYGISLWSVCVTCPVVSPPSLLCTP